MIIKTIDSYISKYFLDSSKKQNSVMKDVDELWNLRLKFFNTKYDLKKHFLKRKYDKILQKYNAFIPLNKEVFLDKPIFPHGINGVFISSKAKIGSSCVVFHQVTIGSNTLKDSPNCGSPSIGNNVYIGCGAKIIGNVSVGDNVRIGANCVVTKNVTDNCTVVMNYPRVIKKDKEQCNSFLTISQFEK